MAICVYYLVGRCIAGTKCHNKHIGPAFPTPCRNFVLHNTCTWGARCRYAHPTPVAPEDPSPSRPSCRDFLSGRGCKFGSKCLQYHPGAVEKADSSSIPAPSSTPSTTITLTASKATDIANITLTKDEFTSIVLASLTESNSTPDLPLLQSATTTPVDSEATDIANVKLFRDKYHSTISAPSTESSSIPDLPLPQSAMTTPAASKAVNIANIKLTQNSSASTLSTPSTKSDSTPDLSLPQSITTTPAGSRATDTTDVKSFDVKVVDTMLASSVDPSSDDAAPSPLAQTSLSLDRDQTDAIYVKNSNNEFDGTKPAPSTNPDSNPTSPPSQSLTSISTNLKNTDEIGDPFLTAVTFIGDSYELVRSTTRSPSPVDSEYDTSSSTVPEEASPTPKLVQSDSGIDLADSMNNNKQFNNFADQSTAPFITPPNDSSTDLGLASAVQSADLNLPPDQLPSFMDEVTHVHSPDDTVLSTVTEDISITPLIITPINPSVEPKPASAVECTSPDLPENNFFYKLIAASAAADKQHLEISPISTKDQTAINELSHLVIDCSAATVPSNLELEGPGIYERKICHSVVLCTWPQESNIPALSMVETLTTLASTFGEIVCAPFYRNAGFSHSLQFTFQHPHEAASASAQLNGQYIKVAGTYMSVQTSVTHQITVTYMIPQHIIDSLGRHGQGNLHALFEQNFCQLQWNNFHRYHLSGELVTEVTIMGMYEGQVAQCKAVLEDLIRGRVLTHEEGDNRPLWHNFFNTEKGTVWLKEKTEDNFYMKVRAVRMANLNVLMLYGSSEWTRNEFGGIVKKKIEELMEEEKKAAEISAVVAEELRLMRLRVQGKGKGLGMLCLEALS
ncbi:a3176482-e4b0-49f0-a57a-cdd942b1feea [Sclerotinia trifoliorum]|uniref:A3176482-e4b0-49f0-a57a-cdd942b1feea n=1 Tax=Sclerotinia trifoliorum TaxID=28548 RepID=A0A8H2VVJ4_9HELO|nr:a3176482-e4b0-49f0-a57a-cdd942b1feea [Sclerotinia trifoliorum]